MGRKFIPVVNEIEGRQWCEDNGYIYMGTRNNRDYGYIMEYEDCSDISRTVMSPEEEAYYLKMYEKEEKKQAILNEKWVIASDDGINSTMYRSNSKKRNELYTFYISEAKICTKVEAQKTAALMTQRSKVGRIWYGLRVQ